MARPLALLLVLLGAASTAHGRWNDALTHSSSGHGTSMSMDGPSSHDLDALALTLEDKVCAVGHARSNTSN